MGKITDNSPETGYHKVVKVCKVSKEWAEVIKVSSLSATESRVSLTVHFRRRIMRVIFILLILSHGSWLS